MIRLGIEPRSPGPLANTLPTKPMSWLKIKYADSKGVHKKIDICSVLFWAVSYIHMRVDQGWPRYIHGMWPNKVIWWLAEKFIGWPRYPHEMWPNEFIWGLAEKIIGWPRCSHRMWPNEVYFLT